VEKARTEILLTPKVMRQSPSVANWVTMRSITKRKKSERQSDVQKIADRYEHIVYWSDEDRCYIGRCPELFLGGVHGDDVDAVFSELRQVAEENVILHQGQGSLPEPRHTVSRPRD
jgi:predicted RNase H-like HicB family nuclease